MSIPPGFLDEIRTRVPVSDVVGRRVKLIRAGREMKACCPFHNEKTPSFYVNDDKAFYHCFGCGAHGDVISFLIEQEGMEFRDAVETLAAQAGLDMPQENPQARERAKAAQGLHDVAGAAGEYFIRQLHGTAGAEARKYLQGRSLSDATIRAFAIGFAPDRRGAMASAVDAPAEKLIAAGLLIQPEDRGRDPYDRFRNRIMFPIRDTRGRTVGFGGRILGAGEPKYLNSPDGPLFDKGRLLYNLDKAGPAARKSGRLAIVEGYMDVIALAQAGFAEAVAPMGTALTEDQMRLAWRAAAEPVLCFDGDAAGLRAAHRAAVRALPLLEPGRSVRFALLPEGKDPDDLVRESGLGAFEALIESAESLIDHVWRMETEGAEASTPERRAALRQRLYDHAGTIEDSGVQQLYRAEFKSRFDGMFAQKRDRRSGFWQSSGGGAGNRRGDFRPPLMGASPSMKRAALRTPYQLNLTAILTGLLLHPELCHSVDETVPALKIDNPDLERLRSAIFLAMAGQPELDKDGLRADLERRGLGRLAEEVSDMNRLTFSFTRPRTPAATAAEDLACVTGHLMALARIEEENDELRQRNASWTQEDVDRRRQLHDERLRLEQELSDLAQGRRLAAEGP